MTPFPVIRLFHRLRRSPLLLGQQGLTLLEMIISVTTLSLIMGALTASISLAVKVPVERSSRVSVDQSLQSGQQWLVRDAGSAENFTAQANPRYGILTWTDRLGLQFIRIAVTYSYNPTEQTVVREQRKDGVLDTSFVVLKNIKSYEDVVFTWDPAERTMQVSATSSIALEGSPVADRTAILTVNVRINEEPVVFPPGAGPTPTPLPIAGSFTGFVDESPVEVQGAHRSGGSQWLFSNDTLFYQVASVQVSPTVYTVEYIVKTGRVPQDLPPSTITANWVGLSDAANATVSLYVQNGPTSYPLTPDATLLLDQANTSGAVTFNLSAQAVSFVNSAEPHRIFMRVVATADKPFVLSTNQIFFTGVP